MPDRQFPVKLHKINCNEIGKTLFSHHWHPHLEFIYVISGEARVDCNSSSYHIRKGDLIVVNSNELHHGIALTDDLLYYAIIVDPAVLHSQSADAIETKFIIPLIQNQLWIQNYVAQDNQVKPLLFAIVDEITERPFGYELAVKSLLYQLLLHLLRNYVRKVALENDYHPRIRNLERFTPVFQYIEKHYNKEITVEQLAALAGLSRYHFSRLFKELTNKTITEYINQIRIEKSEYLLRNTTMNISEIAHASGFNDIYYFSRTFKKNKNISPSQLRK